MKQISLYEALEKVKLLKKRINFGGNINNEISYEWLIKFANEDKLASSSVTIDFATSRIQACYDHRIKLMENLVWLKQKIADANAKTFIKVGNETYSITEAITKKNLLSDIKRNYTALYEVFLKARAIVDRHNNDVNDPDKEAEYLNKIVGNMTKNVSTEYENLRTLYKKNNEWALYDPIGIQEKIVTKLEELDAFEQQINFKLNQANVSTTIEVPDDI